MTKEIVVEIAKKLGQLEGQNWEQIQRGGSHPISVSKIIKEAQKRLAELKLDDTDDLFSIRFSGRERLWGIRSRNLFQVLWWDPEHKICPSALKHT